MHYRLQYCNEVHYVNNGYSWGGESPPLPPRFLRLCIVSPPPPPLSPPLPPPLIHQWRKPAQHAQNTKHLD